MSGPWEKYKKPDQSGPWARYKPAAQTPQPAPQNYEPSNIGAMPEYADVLDFANDIENGQQELERAKVESELFPKRIAASPQRSSQTLAAGPEKSITDYIVDGLNAVGADGYGFGRKARALGSGLRAAEDAVLLGFSDEINAGMSAITGLGGKFGDYGGNLAREEAASKWARQHNPKASLLGDIGGSLGVGSASVKTGLNLSKNATNMGSKMWRGGADGAILGAIYGAGEAGSLQDRAKSAGVGALKGAGAGATMPVLTAGGQKVVDAYLGKKTPKSLPALSRALQNDLISPKHINQKMAQIGDEAVLADLGSNLRGQAGAIAAIPGPGQQAIRKILEDRAKSSSSRITNDLKQALGPVLTPSKLDVEIATAKQILSPQYEAALRGAKAIDTTKVAQNLDNLAVNLRGEAQGAAKKLRGMFNVVGTNQLDPNPRTILEIRHAIDGLFDGVTDGNVRRVLGQTREQVDDLLSENIPGLKKVDAQFEEFSKQQAAYDRGRSALGGGKTTPHPSELADEFSSASLGAKIRMNQGAREQIERVVGTNANDKAALSRLIKGEGDWNRERLTTLFGKEKADRIFKIVEREYEFAATKNGVLGNSVTASRSRAMAELEPKGVNPRGMSVIDLALKPFEGVSRAISKSRGDKLNKELAELLMSKKLSPELMRQLSDYADGNKLHNEIATILRAVAIQQSVGTARD